MNQEILKKNFHYNPVTGMFTRLVFSKYNPAHKGKAVGTIDHNGYVRIKLFGRLYLAHRLAFLYMNGRYPIQIDHIDHVRDNNVWTNLREVTYTGNGRNKSRNKKNKSGVTGLVWYGFRRKWHARIKVDGVQIHLGYHASWLEACCARKSAEVKYGFHENHGN